MSEKKILNETKNHTSLYIVVEDAYEAIIFFPPPISEYFFQQHWESEYFFRKKPS
jgi:hypothetical protein